MSKKYVMLPLETVDKLILQIEADLKFIHNRSIQELIDDGQMPDRYLELIAAKQNTWTLENSESN